MEFTTNGRKAWSALFSLVLLLSLLLGPYAGTRATAQVVVDPGNRLSQKARPQMPPRILPRGVRSIPSDQPDIDPIADRQQGDDYFRAFPNSNSQDQNIIFNLPIGRYYGTVNSTGEISNEAYGVSVNRQANLRIEAWSPSNNTDQVTITVNGASHTYEPAKYGMNTYFWDIDVHALRFPDKSSDPTRYPMPRANDIHITHSAASTAQRMVVYMVELDVRGMRPVVLVPGFNFSPGSAGANCDHTLSHCPWQWTGYFADDLWWITAGYPYNQFTYLTTLDWHDSIWPTRLHYYFANQHEQPVDSPGGGAKLAVEVDRVKHIYGVNKVNIIGHSTGVEWGREYALKWDGEASVDKLIMMAGPNEGSFWADAVNAARISCWLAFACGGTVVSLEIEYENRAPALEQLTYASMTAYNRTHGAAPCVTYYDFEGQNQVTYHDFWGTPYLSPTGNDWVVSTASSQALPYSTHLTSIKENCQFCPVHIDEVQQKQYRDVVEPIIMMGQNNYQAGRCSGGSVVNPLTPAVDASSSTSVPSAATATANVLLPPQSGSIGTDETRDLLMTVDETSKAMFNLRWTNYPTSTLDFTLQDPVGTIITPTTSGIGSGFAPTPDGASYVIMNPAPGTWHALVSASSVPSGGVVFSLGGQLVGGVHLDPSLNHDAVAVGQAVQISSTLSDSAPIAGAVVTASIMLNANTNYSQTLALASQGGGVYSAPFTPQQPGRYSIILAASGQNHTGHQFSRQSTLELQVSQGAGLTGGYTEEPIGSQGYYIELGLTAHANVTAPGRYQWSGRLTTQAGKQLGYYNSPISELSSGSNDLPMYFDGTEIGAGGADGPYVLRDFIFTQVDAGNVMVANLPVAYSTASYSRYDWFRPTIIVPDPATEHGIDSNHNSLYDTLEVTIPLDSQFAGSYSASIGLATQDGSVVDSVTTLGFHMNVGLNSLTVHFDGNKIRASGKDGPYAVRDLSIWVASGGQGGNNFGETVLAATRAYRSTDFEGGVCPVPFSDVPAGSTFYTYVQCLACRTVLGGYSDNTFRPSNPLTRGQLAKIVSNAAGFSDSHTNQTFEDVATDNSFYIFVERLAGRNIIGGYACGGPGEPCVAPGNKPYFRPGANVTRGQTSKIVAIAKGLDTPLEEQQTFEDVRVSNSFWSWIEGLSASGTIGGYPCGGPGEPCVAPGSKPYFRPGANITRGQLSKIASKTFFPDCDSSGLQPKQ